MYSVQLPYASVSKLVLVRNLWYENEFDLCEKEPLGKPVPGSRWLLTMEKRGRAREKTREDEGPVHTYLNIFESANFVSGFKNFPVHT